MRFGAGLWCLQATATAPRPHGRAYATLLDDARHLEQCGYESLWLSEHHFFYDGYCPSLLPVASAVLAATSTLRVGTGMMLMPLQDADRAARVAAGIAERHHGRLDVGMGLGYRDIEFDGKGLSRRDRVARLGAGIERMSELAVPAGAALWGGSATPKGAARLGSKGLGIVLSGANPLPLVAELAAAHAEGWESAGRPGGVKPPVAALRNVWLTSDPHERAAALDWQRASYVLYAGLGWSVAARDSTPTMDFLRDTDRAIEDAVATTIAGDAAEVIDGLEAVAAAGVDMTIFRVVLEGAPTEAVRSVLAGLADKVVPQLAGVAA
ncbi:LLM class flavin-dependent oxidoreductase [Agromyces atrinae]|uniref:Alkanesulfonate monooxygenase SsuD/methylene tetrahydromethanopterin reductase-like flavin-dependent oxidoreductase (Luciferase family) n=1 Tax=Agromyces atrinae TaxID=592376 RepID=A0A4Q2M8Q8_9MICO|nr:LLM class flavin-dependent oxidoreductase [Agromyces atrinae]NYD68085.1 alkanesulfonate monooxygenase SsuD/methylene tetrahydromethanopterin reductase-like flavin-dependent oxidoreductase (luciferase family) [Agromyces atrinae]RXZ87767.1 LLM class flavin-dependent oxidoreductase [Agromyces atrinae]